MDILTSLYSVRFFDVFNQLIWLYKLPIGAVFGIFLLFSIRKIDVKERLHAIVMFAYFFLVIMGFWITKPLKKGLFLSYYDANPFSFWDFSFNPAQVELLAKEMNVIVAICATVIFIKLIKVFKKARLSVAIALFFAALFIFLGNVLSITSTTTVWLYYLSGDLFSTLMVATFFAFLNASKLPSEARKVYGFIGLGGVLGGFLGSTVVAKHATELGPSNAAYITAIICLLIVVLVKSVGFLNDKNNNDEQRALLKFNHRWWKELSSDLAVVWHSKYLISIAAIVCLYEVISTLIDYQFTSTILYFVDGPELGEYFSKVFSFTNFISLVTQLFLTGFIMSRFGITVALMVLPVMLAMGSLVFFTTPILIFGSFLNTADNGFSYSINQSAKEALYAAVQMDNRYKAKAFIDIFLLRFAKGFAVILSLLVTTLAMDYESIRWLSLIIFALLIVWFRAVMYVGKKFGEQENSLQKVVKVA